MKFSLRGFVKKGLIDAVGKMENYQIILNAAGWHDKGVLTESDLAEINALVGGGIIETGEEIEEIEETEMDENPVKTTDGDGNVTGLTW